MTIRVELVFGEKKVAIEADEDANTLRIYLPAKTPENVQIQSRGQRRESIKPHHITRRESQPETTPEQQPTRRAAPITTPPATVPATIEEEGEQVEAEHGEPEKTLDEEVYGMFGELLTPVEAKHETKIKTKQKEAKTGTDKVDEMIRKILEAGEEP